VNKHVDAALDYARAVAAGEMPACKWTRLACLRQINDLERATDADWPWVFDLDRASRPCEFVELLPHIKGKWAREGRLIELEPWQCFVITTVFGWVHRETRLRRYREGYVEVPRKNAKSTLSSGLALYMLTADNEHGAEVYSAATTRDQARIVFDDAKAMAQRTPDLRSWLGVAILQHSITVAYTSSKFAPLAAEGSTLDGLNVHFAVIDELHAHKTRAVYDVIDTARGAREQSLLWNITTAGTDRSGICYERRTHVTKILDGVIDDATMFGIVYSLDDGDDPHDPASWAKANPNWGRSVLEDDMAAASRKAEAMPSALNNFLTKRLNVWVSGESAWMDMRAWERCADPDLRDLQAHAGAKVWIGLDLAQKKDFAALSIVFERDVLVPGADGVHEPKRVWNVCTRLYLNELAISESGNAHLSGWARQGYVQMTDGDITDFDVVADDLRTYCRLFDVQEIAFDPALSMYFAGKLIEEGLPLVEITQRAMFFTPPLIQVENLVLEKKLRHDGNPVMTWMVSNLVVKVSKFNELRSPTKERAENKIDGPMAMLMALGRALAQPEDDDIIRSDYRLPSL
jgi:phage terminase large subunit-like protein